MTVSRIFSAVLNSDMLECFKGRSAADLKSAFALSASEASELFHHFSNTEKTPEGLYR